MTDKNELYVALVVSKSSRWQKSHTAFLNGQVLRDEPLVKQFIYFPADHKLTNKPWNCVWRPTIARPMKSIRHFLEWLSKIKNRKTLNEKLDTALCDESHWTKKKAQFNFIFIGRELKWGLFKRTSKNKLVKRLLSLIFSNHGFEQQGVSWVRD